jgi:hypothetical protein
MASTTRLVGLLLIALGLLSYFGTGRTSVTALIPALFGALFLVLALVARAERARKHAIHAALALALVGVIATLGRALPAVADGHLTRPAVLAQVVMALLLIVYVVLGVQSFVAARQSRR